MYGQLCPGIISYGPGQINSLALDHDIDIRRWSVQQHIADHAAHQVAVETAAGGSYADSFHQPENTGAIIRAAGATHYFEAVTGFQAWFKHERRLVNGTAVNILLFSHIRALVAQGKNPGEVIRANNEANPSWVADLAKSYRGPLPGAADFVSEPLKKLGRLPFSKRIMALPVALLRAALNVAVCIVCQGDVRAGRLRW